MARLPRFVLPGFPQHVIQRGNNRQTILHDEEDYWFLWGRLRDAAEKFRCEVHAYVLMPNHFHLVLTPWQDDGIAKLMQYTGRYFVQHVNSRYARTGTLWEGRYRATLFDPDQVLLAVMRYVEGNAVRAGIVDTVEQYDWSSYGANALGSDDELVTAHPAYRALGASADERRRAYRTECSAPLPDDFIQQVRECTNKAWVLGEASFCDAVEQKLNRRALPRPRGGDRRSAAYREAAQQVTPL